MRFATSGGHEGPGLSEPPTSAMRSAPSAFSTLASAAIALAASSAISRDAYLRICEVENLGREGAVSLGFASPPSAHPHRITPKWRPPPDASSLSARGRRARAACALSRFCSSRRILRRRAGSRRPPLRVGVAPTRAIPARARASRIMSRHRRCHWRHAGRDRILTGRRAPSRARLRLSRSASLSSETPARPSYRDLLPCHPAGDHGLDCFFTYTDRSVENRHRCWRTPEALAPARGPTNRGTLARQPGAPPSTPRRTLPSPSGLREKFPT